MSQKIILLYKYTQKMKQFLKILEIINIVITVGFLILYIYRLVHLSHFAVTYKYKSKYPWTRIALCLPYALISLPFLVLSVLYSIRQNDASQFWVIELAVGQCIDSLILILQLIVLRQELNKERPYTPVHLIFCIYLTLLSLVRLIIVLVNITNHQTSTYVFMGFYLAFLVNSVLLLGYWIAKRQQLPEFQKYNYFNFDEFQNLNNTRNVLKRNIEVSYFKKISDSFCYIRPTVTVEKGQFRIILEIYDSNKDDSDIMDRAKTYADNRSTVKQVNIQAKLKIISNQIYSMNQILELYKLCGRFNIKQKLDFNNHNLGDMYKNLQLYLDELFSNKKNYLRFLLRFFDAPDDFMENSERALRETFKDSQMDIYANMDKNATLISVRVFKQLWIDEYYMFYMDVLIIDSRLQSRPMRRYNDFEMFHNQLSNIIRKRYGGKLTLPTLPSKYLFNWDETKITQRRNQLQFYLRSLTNDYKLMLECHEIRQATLEFLGIYEVINISPVNQVFKQFYNNIQVFKGSVSKQLTNSEYVTFYEFKILYNGIPVRVIKKRFNDFVVLHQNIERWMNNTQISYKFLVLPQKHLYKSGAARHENLKIYLQSLIKVQQVWKVYEVNVFLQVGNNTLKDMSMSGIKSPTEENWNTRKNTIEGAINQEDDRMTQRFIDQESFESKGRMSALIDELGD